MFTALCENVAEGALVFISFSVQDLAVVCSHYLYTRAQSLHLLTISDMCKGSKSYTLFFKSLLKQSRPGFLCGQLELFAYPPDRRLCVVLVLKEYLERTKNLRGSCTDLFISYAETFAKFYKRPIKKDAELYQHAILKH